MAGEAAFVGRADEQGLLGASLRAAQSGQAQIISGGLTLYIKFDGFNENGSNANPPYEGPFTLEWSQQS